MYYKQCQLKRDNTVMVVWLPENVIRGRVIVIDEMPWTIDLVYSHVRIPESYLDEFADRDHLHQREASDI